MSDEVLPSLDELAAETWDAVVVGAGLSGAACAATLAQRGWRTLLLERSRWPRDKTCGGCLNAKAVGLLNEMGLNRAVRSAVPIQRTMLCTPHRRVQIDMPVGGVAIGRREMDGALVDVAIQRGAVFVPLVSATLQPAGNDAETRCITVQSGTRRSILHTRVALACDGIGGGFLKNEPGIEWDIATDAWIGVSATLPEVGSVAPHTIHMHVAEGGYAGVVRMADGSAHLAAALSPVVCRAKGGPAHVVNEILRRCGGPPMKDTASIKGTGLLTRRRRTLGSHRMLAVGDACGYVEPFTGEGMEWALRSARDAVALLEAPDRWSSSLVAQWAAHHRATVDRQHRRCRTIRYGLHRPPLATAAVTALAVWPALANWVMK